MIGKIILNYEIKSLIGEGGMGTVYLAHHTQVERKVAVKVLLPQFLKNQEIRQRFKNEASMMAHMQHPNIVSLYDYVEDDTGMYVIMEYVEGTPLDEYIAHVTGPMPESKAVPIMKQVLEAFNYAHQQKVVHRDIKPANILIGQNGQVKILDFGIARIIGEGAHNLTKTGTQMGTVFYMSPEQVQGKKVDHLSDIYSLGVTFYQMLTGINPYKGITTEYEVYSKIVNEELPDPKSIYPAIPDYLIPIVSKALAKQPEDRFSSCSDFLQAIENRSISGFKVPPVPVTEPTTDKPVNKPDTPSSVNSNSGIAPLVLGILSLLFCCIPFVNILGIILGILALVLSKKNVPGANKVGKILGLIGLILSTIILLISIYFIFLRDSDGDGVADSDDSCPYQYGSLNGCPDSDKDGVEDAYDTCPYSAGDLDHNGCPDSDEDGVFDDTDECDAEFGPTENNGCPWPDQDSDGVPDKDDNCYDEYGPEYNDGCPEYESYEESTYKTVCPYCGNTSYETRYNITWNCGSCQKDFYGCMKSNGDYGIKTEWNSDGECDCYDCSDE